MPRRLFTVASALSLVLILATMVLWVRSYWLHDSWAWSNSGYVQVHSVAGEVALWWGVPNPGDRPASSSIRFIWDGLHQFWGEIHRPVGQFPWWGIAPKMTVHWNLAGFISAEHDARKVHQSPLYHLLALPYWSFVAVEMLVTAVLLRGAVRLWRGARLQSSGRCRRCGYDLRATPDRCPECGSVTSTSV